MIEARDMQECGIWLTHSPHTDNILIGYRTASFNTEDFSGDVVVSGKTVRVYVDGVDGYVDIDIRPAIEMAVGILMGDTFESLQVRGRK